MQYRQINETEYTEIAAVHDKVFNDFFLTSLGINFLRIYYKTSLKNKESIAICATNQDLQIVGFSIGCEHSVGYHKRLVLRNFFTFLTHGVIVLFTKPIALIRLAKNFDKNESTNDDGNYAELLSIAVLPSCKGLGVGKALIKAFEEEALKRGCKKVALTTDYINNQDVLSFYKNTGYEIFYEFTTFPARKMFKLIKNISHD